MSYLFTANPTLVLIYEFGLLSTPVGLFYDDGTYHISESYYGLPEYKAWSYIP